ncbi:isochorismatase family protein [Natrialba swarupiae]|nr:isochorismatase family protein [Natrialba swarupiae]
MSKTTIKRIRRDRQTCSGSHFTIDGRRTKARNQRILCESKDGRSPVELGRWTESTGLGEDDQGHEPTDGNPDELADGIEPGPQDVVIDEKYKPSMFFGTQLESMLSYDGVDTLIVTGMTTSGCVRATVVDAFSYNYRIIVPEECVADRSQISHETTLFDIDMKYGDVRPLDDVLEQL